MDRGGPYPPGAEKCSLDDDDGPWACGFLGRARWEVLSRRGGEEEEEEEEEEEGDAPAISWSYISWDCLLVFFQKTKH